MPAIGHHVACVRNAPAAYVSLGDWGVYSQIERAECGWLNVRFAPDSDQIADIAEGPRCAMSGH
jgi:hypothetical protein